MADKEVKIRMTTAGADQAASEFKKVADAAEGVQEATSSGFGGMLDAVPEKAETAAEKVQDLTKLTDELVESIERVGEETEAAGQQFEDASEQADKLDENVENIARAQKAQALAEFAGLIGRVGGQLREAAKDAQGFDKDLAVSLDNAGKTMEGVAEKGAAMAQGFAVGGPVGAGLALNVTLLKDAVLGWFDMAESMDAAAAAEARMLEMQGKLNMQLQGFVDPAQAASDATAELARRFDEETDAIDRGNESLRNRNELMDARARLESARGNLEDQAAIRKGAAPEDVKAARAMKDAEAAKAKIDRDLEAEAARVQEEFNRNQIERGEVDRLKASGASGPEFEAREKRLLEAEKANSSDRSSYQTAADRGVIDKATIDAAALGKAGSLQDAKTKRLADEKKKADDKAKRDKEQADRKRESDERRKESEARAREREEASIGRAFESALPKNVSEGFRRRVSAVASGLQDGDQGGEIDKLAGMLDRVLSFVEQDGKTSTTKLDALERKVENLQGQVKKARRDIK